MGSLKILRNQGPWTETVWEPSGQEGDTYLQLKISLEVPHPHCFLICMTNRSTGEKPRRAVIHMGRENHSWGTQTLSIFTHWSARSTGDYELYCFTLIFLRHNLYSVFYSTLVQFGIGSTLHLINRNMEHRLLPAYMVTKPSITANSWKKAAPPPVPSLFWEATRSFILNTFSNSEPHLTLITFLQPADKRISVSDFLRQFWQEQGLSLLCWKLSAAPIRQCCSNFPKLLLITHGVEKEKMFIRQIFSTQPPSIITPISQMEESEVRS